METDASQEGLIAVLSQEHDGKYRVIAYDSRRLRPTERNMDNYSLMKLEFLALKWAVTEKFRSNLLAAEFEVLTDNNPLSHLETAKLGAVEQSWAFQLALFNFKITYKPGKNIGLCLNPTAQKDNQGVLGASFRAEEFSEIVRYSNMVDYTFS